MIYEHQIIYTLQIIYNNQHSLIRKDVRSTDLVHNVSTIFDEHSREYFKHQLMGFFGCLPK